mmetsp:Transcript_18184/g.57126  ORF Transcript_18184/g.57126 Transcript_18184/m.57126 type:complete len:215 (+) Transcript_18184:492-1136(+)
MLLALVLRLGLELDPVAGLLEGLFREDVDDEGGDAELEAEVGGVLDPAPAALGRVRLDSPDPVDVVEVRGFVVVEGPDEGIRVGGVDVANEVLDVVSGADVDDEPGFQLSVLVDFVIFAHLHARHFRRVRLERQQLRPDHARRRLDVLHRDPDPTRLPFALLEHNLAAIEDLQLRARQRPDHLALGPERSSRLAVGMGGREVRREGARGDKRGR